MVEATTRHTIRGMTLTELAITLLILSVVAAGASAVFGFAIDASRNAKAVADIAGIGGAIIKYQVDNDRLPETLSQVGHGGDRDPWGNAYRYLSFQNGVDRGAARKDRNLVPINTLFDLYSMGKDGATAAPLSAATARDDIVWANDGAFIGRGEDY